MWVLAATGVMPRMRIAAAEPAESLGSQAEGGRERPEPLATPFGLSRAPSGLNAATVLSLQRTAGNAAVSALMSGDAASRGGAATPRPADDRRRAGDAAIASGLADAAQQRALMRAPAVSQPPAKAVGADGERRYDFEATVYGKPVHYRNLTPQEVIAKLRQLWRFCHDELDEGRGENLRLADLGRQHRTAAFWSNVAGGTSVPDPAMWNEVGAGTLSEVREVLDSTDAALKAGWEHDRNLPPEVARLPIMQAAAAFDATTERIKQATGLLTRAAAELAERQRRLDEFVGRTTKGAERMITGIKVEIVLLTVVAGGYGAAFAGEGAGVVAQAAAGAGTAGVLGVSGEFFTQVGEMRIDEREHFDVARIAKRGAKDVVTAFVGGVIGGKFAKVLRDRIGGWVSGLSKEALAAQGLSREAFLTNGQRLFIEWIGGAVASSPFTTTASALMDRALEGEWKVHTFGEFADRVIDEMIQSAAMGGFLIYGGHALNRSAPPATTSPAAGSRTSAGAATHTPRPATKSTRRPAASTRAPARRAANEQSSAATPAKPEVPVIEESPPGGFEPTTREPPVEDPGPEPVQVEIDPEKIGEVENDGVPDPIHDEPATAPHTPVIEESTPGGSEPTTSEPPVQDSSPEPVPDEAVTASRPALGLGTPPSGARGPVSEDVQPAARDRRRARPYNYRPPRGAPPAPSAPGRKPATPTPETRVKADPERQVPSVVEGTQTASRRGTQEGPRRA